MSEELLKKMAQRIIEGNVETAIALAQESITIGMEPMEAITNGFVVGVNTVGDAFGRGEMFLPVLVMAGEAMKAAVAVLDPELRKRGTERRKLGKEIGRAHV